MSGSEIKYLLAIHGLGRCRVKDLSAKLGYSKASVCRAADRLGYLRLVKRGDDKSIFLTEEGMKAAEKYCVCLNEVERVLTDLYGCSVLRAGQDAASALSALSEESINCIYEKARHKEENKCCR